MKKIIIFLTLISSSMAYSNYRVSFSSLSISTRLRSGRTNATIHQQNITIIRNSVNEGIYYITPKLNILSFNDHNFYHFDLNLYDQRRLGFEVTFKGLNLNGNHIPSTSSDDVTSANFHEDWRSRASTNYSGKYHFVIPPGTPDFKNKDLGSIIQDNTGTTITVLATLTLITEKPLKVTVPDINFGDVLTTKNSVTKTGNILIRGKKDTDITLSISNPRFKLSRVNKKPGEIDAQAAINGQTQGIRGTIDSRGNLTKNLSVTISNFSTLDSGKYSGSVTININSN